jgi:hypothetical protein
MIQSRVLAVNAFVGCQAYLERFPLEIGIDDRHALDSGSTP